jgi:intein-encoded DNA endonuclease-like protein
MNKFGISSNGQIGVSLVKGGSDGVDKVCLQVKSGDNQDFFVNIEMLGMNHENIMYLIGQLEEIAKSLPKTLKHGCSSGCKCKGNW